MNESGEVMEVELAVPISQIRLVIVREAYRPRFGRMRSVGTECLIMMHADRVRHPPVEKPFVGLEGACVFDWLGSRFLQRRWHLAGGGRHRRDREPRPEEYHKWASPVLSHRGRNQEVRAAGTSIPRDGR